MCVCACLCVESPNSKGWLPTRLALCSITWCIYCSFVSCFCFFDTFWLRKRQKKKRKKKRTHNQNRRSNRKEKMRIRPFFGVTNRKFPPLPPAAAAAAVLHRHHGPRVCHGQNVECSGCCSQRSSQYYCWLMTTNQPREFIVKVTVNHRAAADKTYRYLTFCDMYSVDVANKNYTNNLHTGFWAGEKEFSLPNERLILLSLITGLYLNVKHGESTSRSNLFSICKKRIGTTTKCWKRSRTFVTLRYVTLRYVTSFKWKIDPGSWRGHDFHLSTEQNNTSKQQKPKKQTDKKGAKMV